MFCSCTRRFGGLQRSSCLGPVLFFALLLALFSAPGFSQQTPDEAYGEAEMAEARHHLRLHNGAQTFWQILVDRFEYQEVDVFQGTEEVGLLDLSGWIGGDLHKFRFEVESEYLFDESEFEEVEVQGAWSKAISPYFDFTVGVRHDFEPGPSRTFAVVGLEGLAPYWFELDAELFLSDDGDVEASVEAEYEMLFTQKLIGQFRFELDAAAQDVEELGIGSGLSHLEAGFRLRYEFVREFAPYVGVEWLKDFGRTADFSRAAGSDPESTALVVGLRVWY